ncbi:MAG: glycosyltransferase family 4 protein [Abitibacteriaceae bacterium]|nr:glycosyltransferase family 4 protein [Abditibacteriaceae bacterium]
MKVTVSVFGRFHAFDLAHQLEKRGVLQQLITTYPKREVFKYGIPPTKVNSLLTHELVARGWNKFPSKLTFDINAQFWLHERFDKAASKLVSPESDLYIGWASFSEQGLQKAKAYKAVTIVERGSSHIEYQRDILREEYERHGLQPHLPHPKVIEKEKREYDLADYISVPSEFVRRTFLGKGFPEDKLIKVPYGVDLSNFNRSPQEPHIFRILYVGTMSLRKGVHYLMQAFAKLQLHNAELWLVGHKLPEIDPFFREYEGCFRYFDPVPQNELPNYYSQCSVFALCSIEEGMAMVQAQAMACGLPLVCTTNTGGEDLVTHGQEGFVVPIRDVEAIKENLLYLYEHPDVCRMMGEAAKWRIQQGFTWDDYGGKIHKEYQRALANKHQSAR